MFINLKLFKMKRNENKVPEFDEIIFENRNKNYGAFDLRKHYKSATSLSILGGTAFFTMLTLAITLTTEEGKAKDGPVIGIIELSNPVIPPELVPPEVKPPADIAKVIKNLQPVVTNDTSDLTAFIPTTDEVVATITNGNPADTAAITEPSDPVIPPEKKIFTIVEEMPEFPGGIPALLKYVGKNLVYPEEAQINNIKGMVTLKFVVNPDGSVDRIEVLKSVDPLLDNEAVRVVKTLPKFKPGKQGGVPVPVWFMLPVVFKLQNN